MVRQEMLSLHKFNVKRLLMNYVQKSLQKKEIAYYKGQLYVKLSAILIENHNSHHF